MKVISVSGSVCTGKTTYAKKLARRLRYKYIDLNKIIDENKLKGEYDKRRKTYSIDVKKLNRVLIKLIKKSKESLVIDGHLSHFLPKKYVNEVIILKCSLKKLKKRLEKRGYSKLKVRENLDAEIFDVCFEEAKELGHKVRVVEG
ncbi:MAG: kinase [Nanoarchaeota archaeon]|nr:kinase [Nanoarchaeota archaeon]|tara:strand:+ start:2685 stop:3119 length:435 start_codon:yes stop_codon:yes gene_type:complete